MKKTTKKPKRNLFSMFVVGFVLVFVALVSLLVGSSFIQQSRDSRSAAAGTRCLENKTYTSTECFGKNSGDVVNNGKSICKGGKKYGAFVACTMTPISTNAGKKCLEDTSRGSDIRCFDKKDGDLIDNGKSICVGVSDYGVFTVCKVLPYGTNVTCSTDSDAKCKGKKVESVVGEHQICLPDTQGPQNPATGQVKCFAGCEKNYKLSGNSCVPISCPSGQVLNAAKTECVASGGGSGSGGSGSGGSGSGGSGSGGSGSGGSGSGGSGSGGSGGNGGGGGSQPPTISATVRGNYCAGFTAAVNNSTSTVLSPGNSVTLTSWANALGNKFWYIAYNRDNLNGPNDPKPVCVTTGGDVTTVTGPCPAGSHQLIYLNPNSDLRLNSGAMSKTWEQVFLPDTNWNGKRVNRIQLNAYFSVTGGQFSLPNATCVKTLDSGYVW